MTTETRQIAFLRPDQIRAEMARVPLAYLPLGPLEWHGPHLPLGVDPLHAEKVALMAVQETGGLVFPPFYWGTERERSPRLLDWLGFGPDEWIVGMDFPANSLPSLYAAEEVFALLVREQLRLAVQMGFKVIVLVSGHGAENHLAVLDRLAAEFSAAGEVKVLVVLPFIKNQEGVMEVGHASQVETSVMQALYPECVELSALPALPERVKNADWAIVDFQTFAGSPTPDRTVHDEDDPRLATAEKGRQNMELAAGQIATRVYEVLGKKP